MDWIRFIHSTSEERKKITEIEKYIPSMGSRWRRRRGFCTSACRRDWDLGERQLKCEITRFQGPYRKKRETRNGRSLDIPSGLSRISMHRKEKIEGRSSRNATHTLGGCGGGGGREPAMQALARAARGILPATAAAPAARVQQARGIVVHVKDGNLERALGVMARKMRSSGIERLIRARSQIHHHVKDSEKRVLARKALMQRVRSQELGKKLRDILIKKIRSAPPPPPCHYFHPATTPFLCPRGCELLCYRIIVVIGRS